MPRAEFTQADVLIRELLKELRTASSLTQMQLAARLGRPQSYVSKYESGDRRLDFVETFFVCRALDVSLKDVAITFTRRLSAARRAKSRGGDRGAD